jgi:hypothetical protein
VSKLGLALAACRVLGGCAANLGSTDAVPQGVVQDGWTIEVSFESSDLGPITVSVGPMRRVRPNDSRAWVEHDLVFANTGDRPVTFADSRRGALLGPRGNPLLLAADQGCGYAPHDGRIELACLMYLDIPTVEPQSALTRTVTLWKDLPGMEPLKAGTYVFRKTLRFKDGHKPPAEGAGRTATLRLVYRVDLA